METIELFTPMLDGVRQHWENVLILNGQLTRGRKGYMCSVRAPDGQEYRIYGASCGIPECFCDARAIPEARFKHRRHNGD